MTRDLLDGKERIERAYVDKQHGMVALVDMMPRLVPDNKTGDTAIVQAARVSYGDGTKKVSEDKALIRYLIRNQHNTPLEMVEFKFHVRAPIFVARQWMRHRTASINEYSARYSIVKELFYMPRQARKQSTVNKQGGEDVWCHRDSVESQMLRDYMDNAVVRYHEYQALLEQGVSRELARVGLPQCTYTEWYWKVNLHNLFHFLKLRIDTHAQWEIRQFAQTIWELIEPRVPLACAAFSDYVLNGVTLSALELNALETEMNFWQKQLRKYYEEHGGYLDIEGEKKLNSIGKLEGTKNKREQREWAAKRRRLGDGEQWSDDDDDV